MAVKVKLLQKKISGGRKTLYLDFYPAIISLKTGKETRREFLGLYIHEKPKNAIEKQYNAEQLKLAEAIRQQKENTHNKPEIYNEYEKERLRKKELGDRDFVEYFRRTAGKRSGSNHNNWMSALTYLEQFTGGRVKFADLSEQYLEEFKEYLLTTQSVSILQSGAISETVRKWYAASGSENTIDAMEQQKAEAMLIASLWTAAGP